MLVLMTLTRLVAREKTLGCPITKIPRYHATKLSGNHQSTISMRTRRKLLSDHGKYATIRELSPAVTGRHDVVRSTRICHRPRRLVRVSHMDSLSCRFLESVLAAFSRALGIRGAAAAAATDRAARLHAQLICRIHRIHAVS